MKSLNQEREIIAMACALRLTGNEHVQNIIEFCRSKIAKWLETSGQVRTIWDLEELVCERLNLEICDIWNEDDLDNLIRRFVEEGDIVFAHLKMDLDEKTFATLIRRRSLRPNSEPRYVAVIDCRGTKRLRRFFSRWHEIAHLLTLYQQMELPFHRSTTEKDPLEKLMDIIAGDVGFYAPMFVPVLQQELRNTGRLTFAAVENVRSQFCPDASFQSTLNACAAHTNSPLVLLEIGMGYKKSELRQLNCQQIDLIPAAPPKLRLRVLNSMANSAAREISLQIPRFMRVPSSSVLAATFNCPDGSSAQTAERIENLCSWISSDGSRLPGSIVSIQAQRSHDRVFGIVAPVTLSTEP